MSTPQPLEILPLLPADLPSVAHIYTAAFLPGAVGQSLYGAADPRDVSRLLNARLGRLTSKPRQTLLKAVRAGEIVGFAWFCAPGPDAGAGAEGEGEGEGGAVEAAEEEATEFAAGTRVELLKQFSEDLAAHAKTIEGRHWHLEQLGTHPDHQSTGVARALARWGIDRARADGLDLHLDATLEGAPLYEKLGFVPTAEPVWIRDGSAAFYPMVLRNKPEA